MHKLIIVSIVSLSVSLSLTFTDGIVSGIESTPRTGDSMPTDSTATKHELNHDSVQEVEPDPAQQISAFVRRIFQDKKGNLWFGTNGDGVCRYDGVSLKYFSLKEGFGGVAVRGIVEDKEGNVWFGTERGITKYDGKSFTNFTETDGLVNNDVWSIVIDSKGIIWIGTLQGISRFNGKEFTPFDLPDSKPDPTRGVTSAKIVHSIMEDSKGKMWFGTNGGAYIYDGKNLTNISEKDGLCSNAVNCVLEDKDGNFWFATHHNGVCRWDGKSFTHFTSKDGVNGTEAWDLYKDRSGNVWFPIENSGVYRYDGKSFTNFQKEQGLTTNAIQCTFEDKEGRLWLGGWMGLFRYDGKSIFSVGKKGPWQEKNRTDVPQPAADTGSKPAPEKPDVDPYFVESTGISSKVGPQVITRNVLQDSKGGFWLATWHGVMRYDGTTFTNVTNKDGLRRYRAFSLLEDHQKNIWVGTVGGAGAYRYDPSAALRPGGETWTNFTTKDGLVDNSIVSMMQDSDNNIWFGAMGVTKYDGKIFTSFTKEDGFTSSDVNSISQAPDGTIWFGTRGALFHYDGKTFVNFTEEHGLNYPGYVPTVIDRKGHLWFSGENGVYHYDGEKVQHLFKSASYSLFEDSHGNIWFSGGALKGEKDPKPGISILNRFDPAAGLENILDAREQIEIQQGAIFGLAEDKDGNIWFGTGRGIGRIEE